MRNLLALMRTDAAKSRPSRRVPMPMDARQSAEMSALRDHYGERTQR